MLKNDNSQSSFDQSYFQISQSAPYDTFGDKIRNSLEGKDIQRIKTFNREFDIMKSLGGDRERGPGVDVGLSCTDLVGGSGGDSGGEGEEGEGEGEDGGGSEGFIDLGGGGGKLGFSEVEGLTGVGEVTPDRSPFKGFNEFNYIGNDNVNETRMKILEDFGMNTSEAWDELAQKVEPKVFVDRETLCEEFLDPVEKEICQTEGNVFLVECKRLFVKKNSVKEIGLCTDPLEDANVSKPVMVDCRTETEAFEGEATVGKKDWVMVTDPSRQALLAERVDVGLWTSLLAGEDAVVKVDVSVDADSILMEDTYEMVRLSEREKVLLECEAKMNIPEAFVPVVPLDLPVPPTTEDKSLMTDQAPHTPPTETRDLGLNTDPTPTSEKITETTTPQTKDIQTDLIPTSEISTLTDEPQPPPTPKPQSPPKTTETLNLSNISSASSRRQKRKINLKDLQIEDQKIFSITLDPQSPNKSYDKSMTGLESLTGAGFHYLGLDVENLEGDAAFH
jgi:hypothetical protein